MTEMSGEVQVVDNASAERFEATVDGYLAQLAYRRDTERLVLVHAEVPDEIGGRGIGGRLVSFAVEQARAAGLLVVPRCPFARAWLRHHPELAGGVNIEWGKG